MTRLDPVHLGEFLEHDLMVPLALSATALPKPVGVTLVQINEIVRDRQEITAETVLHLDRYFNTDAESCINLQDRYELEPPAWAKADALHATRPHQVA